MDEACACASLRSPQLTEYEKLTKESQFLVKREEEMESDPQNVDYEQLAQVKSQTLAVRQQLEALEPQVADIQVTIEDLAKVIELCTGISAAKIQESEYKKIGSLEDVLRAKVIGQNEAIASVCAAIRRNRAGNQQPPPSRLLYLCGANRGWKD